MTHPDITWVKEHWPVPVVVTGVQSVADAVAAVDAGADALVLSNHGGRQLDRAPVPLGRAYLYGLMLGGRRGVDQTLEVVTAELRRAMSLLGTPTVADLGPEHVRLRTP